MKSLYIVGGRQRGLRSLRTGAQDWYEYQKGIILRVAPETGAVETLLEYVSPPDACAAEDPVILFKSGTLEGNTLYLCTQTEVLLYALPDFKQMGYVSLPCFNDVHHVRPTPEGNLLVANTGLDMVVEVTPAGEMLREWNVLGEDPWQHFSRTIDYRKGISTKPHRAHPNYVYYLDDEIWVTRFQQGDTICLTRPNQHVKLHDERCHDGVMHGDHVYFTTVGGNLVIVDRHALRVEEVLDLAGMQDPNTQQGWCRALFFDDERVWVGFSRLRPTRFRDNVSWVKSGFRRFAPTHIACYDLKDRRRVSEIDLEAHGLNAVFGIFPAGNGALEI